MLLLIIPSYLLSLRKGDSFISQILIATLLCSSHCARDGIASSYLEVGVSSDFQSFITRSPHLLKNCIPVIITIIVIMIIIRSFTKSSSAKQVVRG